MGPELEEAFGLKCTEETYGPSKMPVSGEEEWKPRVCSSIPRTSEGGERYMPSFGDRVNEACLAGSQCRWKKWLKR